MANPGRDRDEGFYRDRLPRRGLEKTLEHLDAKIRRSRTHGRSGGVECSRFSLVRARLSVLLKANEPELAIRWLLEVQKKRSIRDERELWKNESRALVAGSHPFQPDLEEPLKFHAQHWGVWAVTGEFDLCEDICGLLGTATPEQATLFRSRIERMAKDEAIHRLAGVQLAAARGEWTSCLTGLQDLAGRSKGLSSYVLKLLEKACNAQAEEGPLPRETSWACVEIRLAAGQREAALEELRDLVLSSPEPAVSWMEAAVGVGKISPAEAERIALWALDHDRLPHCEALLVFLFGRFRSEGRNDEALRHLMVLIRSLDGAGKVWDQRERLAVLVVESPEDLVFRTAHAELCCLANRETETAEALTGMLKDAPKHALRILGLWHRSLPPRLAILKGRTLHETGRRDEATEVLSGVFERIEDAEALLPVLEDLVGIAPDHLPYSMLRFRVLHRLTRENEALGAVESLLQEPSRETEHIHDVLAAHKFGRAARARSIYLLARACLDLGRKEGALSHLDILVREDRALFRAALEYGMKWRDEWMADTEHARRFARHLFEAGMLSEAIGIVDGATTAIPEKGSERAVELAAVFQSESVAHRREPEVLRCHFRTQMRSHRYVDALKVAMAMADSGNADEAYDLLSELRGKPTVEPDLHTHLLDLSLRLGKEEEEVVSHASKILDSGQKERVRAAYEALGERDEKSVFHRDRTHLLGRMAMFLEAPGQATAHFEKLLHHAAAPADEGLERILALHPKLSEVRVVLADSRRERELPKDALVPLEAAPDRTPEVRAALIRLVEEYPVHIEAWFVHADWLKEDEAWDDLLPHLDQLRQFDKTDLRRVDGLLDEIRSGGLETTDCLWLSARVAHQLVETNKEIEILFEVLQHGEDQHANVFAAMDAIRKLRPRQAEVVLSDLRLSAKARSVDRVVAAGRTVLSEQFGADYGEDAIDGMRGVADLSEFDGDRRYHQTILDLSIYVGKAEVASDASDAYARLRELDRDRPAQRLENAVSVQDAFGENGELLVHRVEALLDLERPTKCLDLIRRIRYRESEDGDSSLVTARELAERAAEAAPADLEVRQLASDLAARDGDPEAALVHALAPNRRENYGRVLDQLRAHGERFAEDPRFHRACALEVCEPSGALVKGVRYLQLVLNRAPELCAEVHEISGRFRQREPRAIPIQGVRTRSGVLLAVREAEAAREAIEDLRLLAKMSPKLEPRVLQDLDAVLEIRPEILDGRFLREELLRSLGRTREAIEEVRHRILELVDDPIDEYEARSRLADALEEVHEYDAALEQWRLLSNLAEVGEELQQALPRHIRRNFFRRANRILDTTPRRENIRRACAALRAGRPEDALTTLPPLPPEEVPGGDSGVAYLAIRGMALLNLDRNQQVYGELQPQLDRIPIGSPLSPFEREFLYALGRSALNVDRSDWAYQCLERVAREAPYHRAVRRFLDQEYHRRAAGYQPPLVMSVPLEEVTDAS